VSVVTSSASFNLNAALSRWENEGGADAERSSDASRGVLTIHPAAPFRLDLTAWALRRRPGNAIDRWDGTSFRRALSLTEGWVGVSVAQVTGPDHPHLVVAVDRGNTGRTVDAEVRATMERIFAVGLDLSTFYQMAAADEQLRPLVERFRGVRPPRFPTVFEGLLNAVACQQLSLEAGLSLLNRLAGAYGATASVDGIQLQALPGPQDLAGRTADGLARLGFSRRKAATIISISRAVTSGDLDLDELERIPDDAVVARLTELRGIGRWSAEYVLLRGLGRLHVFPGDDVGARKNLARWLRLESPLDYAGVAQAVARWWPYAGMVYFHLLLNGLSAAGELDRAGRSG
jgi:DNA-3-methyladenine glycosylase II